ncbi:MAG: NTP transferase domain-containing protein [bacterium]
MGRIEAVCISEQKGDRKSPVTSAEVRTDFGIVGDAHAGPWHRQVSLLPRESIDRVRALIPDLSDGAFAENIVTSGLDLGGIQVGDRFRTGGGVILEVTQIGKECHHGCAIREITGDCIMPREGVFCRVKTGGRLEPGDSIGPDLSRSQTTGAILLAGGESRRFGSDKASTLWRGKPLLRHVADTLRPLCSELVVVTGPDTPLADDLATVGDKTVRDDPNLPAGPLRGLVRGLQEIRAPWTWVVACDAPVPQPALLLALRHAAAAATAGCLAVIPQWDQRMQPLLACYSLAALEPLTAALTTGEQAPIQALAGHEYEIFSKAACRRFDPAGLSFLNVNTPEDLARLDEPSGHE